MISHDNLTYSCYIGCKEYEWQENKEVLCSYLPLSHIAPHVIDIYMIASVGGTAFIMDKDALRGTLVSLKIKKTLTWQGVLSKMSRSLNMNVDVMRFRIV